MIALRPAAVLAVGLAVVTLAACTSSGKPNAITPPPSASSSLDSPTDSATATDTGTPTDTATATGTATTTGTATSPASPTRTTSAAVGNECGFAQLLIQAVRGSATQGTEFAQIAFTNRGSTTCTMQGFPGVSLRRGGALLGQPATRSNVKAASVALKPGQAATADVLDFTSCQAPLSDTVRVYPPDSRSFVDLPLDLRGCTLSVKPVVPRG